MPRQLAGRVTFITGASAGIGAATAHAFGRAGSHLVLGARRLEVLETLAEELEGIFPIEVMPIRLDVTDNASVDTAVQVAVDRFGHIDVLFNNAGIGKLDWFENMDVERDLERQIDINLVGVMRVTKAVLPHMQAQHHGHIINMSSMAGYLATPTYTVYAASKFGVRGFSEALRREVKAWGIHVSAVFPAGVRTGFAREAVERRKTKLSTPSYLALTPEKVADRIVRLAIHPKRSLVLPRIAFLAVGLNRIWPGLIDGFAVRSFVKRERAADLQQGS
ncbi:MAG: SDR family oxidoreductase [Anaerolineales bacterium]